MNKTWKQKLNYLKLPPSDDPINRAYDLCPYDKVKVVLIGDKLCKDHNGLVFSTHPKAEINAQQNIIFREYRRDLGYDYPRTGDLTVWANEGILLLPCNGYELLVFRTLRTLSLFKHNIVYILWGADARRLQAAIDPTSNKIISCKLPSTLNRLKGNDDFPGHSPFTETNLYLEEHNIKPINWKLR